VYSRSATGALILAKTVGEYPRRTPLGPYQRLGRSRVRWCTTTTYSDGPGEGSHPRPLAPLLLFSPVYPKHEAHLGCRRRYGSGRTSLRGFDWAPGLLAKHIGNGEAALAAWITARPDLVIVDYSLPGMNGLQLLDNLRLLNGAPVPAIMISGSPLGTDAMDHAAVASLCDNGSTTIQLVASCMDWAKHRRRKAASKCHVRLNLQSFLPQFAIVDTAREHDNVRARELCAGVRAGEIVIFDKAYVDFDHLADLAIYPSRPVTAVELPAPVINILLNHVQDFPPRCRETMKWGLRIVTEILKAPQPRQFHLIVFPNDQPGI
jgi:CheY-like chemotaxis protein